MGEKEKEEEEKGEKQRKEGGGDIKRGRGEKGKIEKKREG